jgi:TP901-1 family phage major tail protein
MAAFVGRKAILSKGATAVAAIRTKTVSINNEPVDITTDDDNGFRTMLQDPGTKSLDMTVEGIIKDDTLLTVAMSSSDILEAFSILFPTIGTLSGDFVVTAFEVGAPSGEAATFSCTLQSSGTFTFAAAV